MIENSIKDRLDRVSLRMVRAFYVASLPVSAVLSFLAARVADLPAPVLIGPMASISNFFIGVAIGSLVGIGLAWVVFGNVRLANLREMIVYVVGKIRLRWYDILLTSLIAGIAEELLFRGVVQVWIGLIPASLAFAIAHGAGIRITKGNMAFGLLIFLLGCLLGTVCNEFGLISAMAAHAALDLVAITYYQIGTRRLVVTTSC